jgi:hypothetical protein
LELRGHDQFIPVQADPNQPWERAKEVKNQHYLSPIPASQTKIEFLDNASVPKRTI